MHSEKPDQTAERKCFPLLSKELSIRGKKNLQRRICAEFCRNRKRQKGPSKGFLKRRKRDGEEAAEAEGKLPDKSEHIDLQTAGSCKAKGRICKDCTERRESVVRAVFTNRTPKTRYAF